MTTPPSRDQVEAYEAKIRTLSDDELRAELADATSAVDGEDAGPATIAIGVITTEQARRLKGRV